MSEELKVLLYNVQSRIDYKYLKIDGTYEYPNSYEGDLIRITNKLITEIRKEELVGRSDEE